MSVLIKGMEMPTSCWGCEVGGAKQMDNAACPFYSMEFLEQENYQDKIADGCPLVPVPPHGRLIDADALEQEFNKLVYHDSWYYNALHHAPTVISAEEGE